MQDHPPGDLEAPAYLSYLQNRIRQKRIDLHKSSDASTEFTVENGVLQFKSKKSVSARMLALLKSGLSKEEAADIMFLPETAVAQGAEWQRRILVDHEAHLNVIASKVQRSLYEHSSDDARQRLMEVAIGVADVPLLTPFVATAPRRGAVVIIPRGLIIIPMWFASLRRLPRPWNELPFEGEPLRRLLGTAGIGIKAALGHTLVGTNSYMFELLHSDELRIGLGGDDYNSTWTSVPELAEFGRRHETTLCERFAIAHELAHVALGHPEMAREARRLNSSSSKKRLEWNAWLRQAEIEADELSLRVLLSLSPAARAGMIDGQHVFNGHQIVDALLVLFLLFHVVEDHKATASAESSHPPARERLRRLLESLVSPHEGARRFFEEIYPQIERDQDVLDQMLGMAIQLGKPKVVSHPDAEMRWFG